MLQSIFSLFRKRPPRRTDGKLGVLIELASFDKGGLDGPATSRQDLLNGQPGAEHHAVRDPHEAPSPVGLHDLRIA